MSSPESITPQPAASAEPFAQVEGVTRATPSSADAKVPPKEVPGTIRYWDGPGEQDLVEIHTGNYATSSQAGVYGDVANGELGGNDSAYKVSRDKRTAIGNTAIRSNVLRPDGDQVVPQADTRAPLADTPVEVSTTSGSPSMPSASLLPLDRYDYTGPLGGEPAFTGPVNEYLNTNRPPMPEVAEVTQAYETQLGAINDSILELGRDLGLDLSDRTRGADYVHLYPANEYQKVNDTLGRPEGSVGTLSASGHLFAAESNTPVNTLGNVSHEALHRAQRRSFRLAMGENGLNISEGTHHHGYTNERTDAFDGLTESLTEMTNIELIRNYWGNHEELPANAETEYTEVGCVPGLLLLDRLISRMPDPHDAYKTLQAGSFTGDMKNLKLFLPLVGVGGMKKLAQLDPTSTASARAIAEDLGETDLVKQLSELKSGDTINTRTLMGWL